MTQLRFFSASKLGANMSLLPSGYLLCSNVPIARTGIQDYALQEMLDETGRPIVEPGANGIIQVERISEEVFRPETIASFNGVEVTDDHPNGEFLDPHNWKKYSIGTAMNVRRGMGAEDSLLFADLVIRDPKAIKAIMSGKREVSCGYDADYITVKPGFGRQTRIVGNHIALVRNGRCGPTCSIHDCKGTHDMVTKPGAAKSWFDRLRDAFGTKDEQAISSIIEEGAKSFTKDEIPGASPAELNNEVRTGGGQGTSTTGPRGEQAGTDNLHGRMADAEVRLAKMSDSLKSFQDSMPKLIADGVSSALKAAFKDKSFGEWAKEEEKEKEHTEDEDMEEEEKKAKSKDSVEEELEEEEKPNKGKSKDSATKVTDSAQLKTPFAQLLAQAAIIAPGLKWPTFDAALAVEVTQDRMCQVRKRALRKALMNPEKAEVVLQFTDGLEPDLNELDCDSMTTLFNRTVDTIKASNNAKVKKQGGWTMDRASKDGGGFASVQSVADLNAAHRAHYGKHRNSSSAN